MPGSTVMRSAPAVSAYKRAEGLGDNYDGAQEAVKKYQATPYDPKEKSGYFNMQCPIDQTTLAMTERQGIEVDYCPNCRGVVAPWSYQT